MSINHCRVCGAEFYADSLLRYNNMPKAAQFLPDSNELIMEKGVDLDVCQCSGCGLVQISNQPVPYFKEVIRATAVSQEMKDFRQNQFKQWLDYYSLQGKKVLEMGCGAGEFLNIIKANPIKVFGIEQGAKSVNKCIELGLSVEQCFIDNAAMELKHAPFDAFYCLNFLEHLPDPNSTLRGLAKNLSSGAIGLIEVPNFNMILRNNMFCEFISDHLFYFTQDTFVSTLKKNGFEVLDCKETWHNYSISAVVKKREKMDLSSFYRQQQILKKDIHQYLSQFSDGEVAIWGAGHQALAVMSLTELKGKIKYVVDSASFKQNKFTPATHIPIVDPERLFIDPVEAIIVMAASYSDEVVGIIKEQHNDLNIAVLRDNGLVIA